MPRSHWKSDLYLLFVVLVWGINFPILKAALDVMHPHVVNVFRFIVSTLVLGAIYYRKQRRAGRPLLEPMQLFGRRLFALGMLGFLVYQFCFIVGIANTKAGSAALIMASAPLWTAVIGAALGFERLRPATWAGLAVTLAGVAVIVAAGSREIDLGTGALFGNVMMLAAALCWGAYTGLSRPVLQHVSASGTTFFGLLCALPFLFGLGLPYLGAVQWDAVGWWVWGALLFSGGLSTGLAVVLWNTAVNDVGASNTAAYSNLVPVAALLGSVVLLGETVSPLQIAGGLLIIGGLLLVRRFRQDVAATAR